MQGMESLYFLGRMLCIIVNNLKVNLENAFSYTSVSTLTRVLTCWCIVIGMSKFIVQKALLTMQMFVKYAIWRKGGIALVLSISIFYAKTCKTNFINNYFCSRQ